MGNSLKIVFQACRAIWIRPDVVAGLRTRLSSVDRQVSAFRVSTPTAFAVETDTDLMITNYSLFLWSSILPRVAFSWDGDFW